MDKFSTIDDSPLGKMSRRTLLLGAAMSGALHALALNAEEVATEKPIPEKLKICVFSKHFQWTDVKKASGIAKDIGFDGIDLTVRAGGRVLPERVESDLPTAVETVRRAGLEVPMITTAITDATTPHAEAVHRQRAN